MSQSSARQITHTVTQQIPGMTVTQHHQIVPSIPIPTMVTSTKKVVHHSRSRSMSKDRNNALRRSIKMNNNPSPD